MAAREVGKYTISNMAKNTVGAISVKTDKTPSADIVILSGCGRNKQTG